MPDIPQGWVAILTIIAGGITSYIIARINNKAIEARVKPQNDKDTVEALEKAMKLVGMDLDEQLDMKEKIANLPKVMQEVQELRDLMENTEIRVTTTHTVSLDGRNPRAEIKSIEAVRVVKKESIPA